MFGSGYSHILVRINILATGCYCNFKRIKLFLFLILFVCSPIIANDSQSIFLKNSHILLKLTKTGETYRLSEISRADGTDKLEINSMEFEILLLNNERLTVNDYEIININKNSENGIQVLRLDYRLRKKTVAPKSVSVKYILGNESYFRKQLIIESDSTGFIDRLQVIRFTSHQKVTGGGLGQPVFINNWFFGMDYPGFYSWHSCNFEAPVFNLRVPYDIDLDGRDKEFYEEPGLVTLYHFPGYSDEIKDNTYKILSKKAVIGISSNISHNAELALLNYIENTRLSPKSFLHFNNWYSIDAKKITKEEFINKTYIPIKKQLDKYDVKLDAMVPDHGWQDGNFEYPPYKVYSPKKDNNHEDLALIGKMLREEGTNLGIWLAFDGRNQKIDKGIEMAGYQSALSDEFDREKYSWTSKKDFFDILQPKYQKDLKESIRYLIEEVGVNYFKHDFNHMFTSNYLTERHAREECLDFTLELLKYERELNPEVFLNFTNGSWFSPFWLQHVNCLWMMSGDSGGNGDYPQLSLREGATTYRDKYFYDNFRFSRPDRPVIPIANFMTHGILFSKKKPFTNFNDIIDDWSNYVVMYYGRGTTVKELYVSPDLLSEQDWEVLGKTTKWAVENQENLLNTIYLGGDAGKAEPYGYVSWNNNKAILTVRNPQRESQEIKVPFNEKIYFRAEPGEAYKAKCIYPFVEEMPWKLKSGKDFVLNIPGDCVMVYEIEKGKPKNRKKIKPKPMPRADLIIKDSLFNIKLNIPDDDFRRIEFLLESWAVIKPEITINGEKVVVNRENSGKKWTLSSWDLSSYNGQEIEIEGNIINFEGIDKGKRIRLKAFLLADRKVKENKIEENENLPPNIMQGYRRTVSELFDYML